MTPDDLEKLRDKVAKLPRETPYEDRPYEAWVRLDDVLKVLGLHRSNPGTGHGG